MRLARLPGLPLIGEGGHMPGGVCLRLARLLPTSGGESERVAQMYSPGFCWFRYGGCEEQG